MPATSWEDQWKRSSRLWKRLLFLLLLFIAAGIIINNNRDVIFGKDNAGNRHCSPGDSLSRVRELPRSEPGNAEAGEVATKPSSRSEPANSPKAKLSERGSTEATKRLVEVPIVDSLLLEDVPCRPLDRGDIRIHLAIMVYYTGAPARGEVPAKRDALKVMARKVIGEMELESIKIDKITPAIFKAMGAVFETNPLRNIAIKTLTIEEVSYK